MFDVFTGPMLELFASSLWETIVMVGISGLIGAAVGVPLGVYLHLTDTGGVLVNRPANRIVGWPLGWSSLYRLMLTMKIVVVLAMMMTALANRYWFVPRLGRSRASDLQAIRAGTMIEIGLALAAILLVSIFGMLDLYGD